MVDLNRSDLDDFIEELKAEFPRFRIVSKKGDTLSVIVHHLLRCLTFGAQSEYLTHYHTVLGDTLYVPDAWERTPCVDKIITLRHERVHLRQRRRFGSLLMAWIYLIPFFPLGLAYGRARLEWEAYRESIVATAQLKGMEEARSPSMRTHIIRQFISGAYGWMWPFRKTVESWYDIVLTEMDTNREP